MNNISSTYRSIISSTPISSSFKATNGATKSSHIKASAISILIVFGIAIISGCISMLYCYCVHKKSAIIQSKKNLDEITPPMLTLKENNNKHTKYQDLENPN